MNCYGIHGIRYVPRRTHSHSWSQYFQFLDDFRLFRIIAHSSLCVIVFVCGRRFYVYFFPFLFGFVTVKNVSYEFLFVWINFAVFYSFSLVSPGERSKKTFFFITNCELRNSNMNHGKVLPSCNMWLQANAHTHRNVNWLFVSFSSPLQCSATEKLFHSVRHSKFGRTFPHSLICFRHAARWMINLTCMLVGGRSKTGNI